MEGGAGLLGDPALLVDGLEGGGDVLRDGPLLGVGAGEDERVVHVPGAARHPHSQFQTASLAQLNTSKGESPLFPGSPGGGIFLGVEEGGSMCLGLWEDERR